MLHSFSRLMRRKNSRNFLDVLIFSSFLKFSLECLYHKINFLGVIVTLSNKKIVTDLRINLWHATSNSDKTLVLQSIWKIVAFIVKDFVSYSNVMALIIYLKNLISWFSSMEYPESLVSKQLAGVENSIREIFYIYAVL